MEVESFRVQGIASQFEDTIPSEFIRLENEQPGITTIPNEVLQVPVIDLGGRQPDDQETIWLVADAAQDWGIFQVVNHGIPNEVISNLQKVGKEFFELPQEEKELIAKPAGSKSLEGYGTKLQKEVHGKKGWVDHLFHYIWPPTAINYKFWPNNPSAYKEANQVYADKVREVGDKLLELLSRGLGLEGQEFKEAVGGDNLEYLLKINYYPPCPRPDLALGVAPHTDMSALTILVPNEVQGLQVFKNGNWYDCKYIPNALIIHIGDQVEIMSNGKYKAVFHRSTVNKEATRISWPVFLQPPPDCEVGPLPKLVNDHTPAKFKTKKFKDYAYCKLNKIPQ